MSAAAAPASLARPAQGARPGVRLRPQISSAPAAASCASSQRRRRAPLPVPRSGRAGAWGPGGLVGDGAGSWATRRRSELPQHLAGPTARPLPGRLVFVRRWSGTGCGLKEPWLPHFLLPSPGPATPTLLAKTLRGLDYSLVLGAPPQPGAGVGRWLGRGLSLGFGGPLGLAVSSSGPSPLGAAALAYGLKATCSDLVIRNTNLCNSNKHTLQKTLCANVHISILPRSQNMETASP